MQVAWWCLERAMWNKWHQSGNILYLQFLLQCFSRAQVNHDIRVVVSIWKSLDFVKVSLVWIVRLMVLHRHSHKASSPLLKCFLPSACKISDFVIRLGLIIADQFMWVCM